MPTHPTNLLDDIWYCFSDNFEDFGAIQAEIWELVWAIEVQSTVFQQGQVSGNMKPSDRN